MSDAYGEALLAIAEAYERQVIELGGKSLSRVATIVASSGAFFKRLKQGRSFSVENLDRFIRWFRRAENWPERMVPDDAAAVLAAIGRPVTRDVHMPLLCGTTVVERHLGTSLLAKREVG